MKTKLSVLAIALAMGVPAFAAEVPASFDAKNCKAEYPKASLMNEEQGTVSMSFLIAANGEVKDSKLDKSSGFKNLDKAAPRTVPRRKPGPRWITPGSWTDRSAFTIQVNGPSRAVFC